MSKSAESETASATGSSSLDGDNFLTGIDVASRDILEELYCYILRQRQISAQDLTVQHVADTLEEEGILYWRDRRYADSWDVALGMIQKSRSKYTGKMDPDTQKEASVLSIDYNSFAKLVSPCARLFLKAFSEELVIPDWQTFCADMTYLFHDAKPNETGSNAQYIPILKEANSDRFGLSICSADGQRFSIGDYDATFSLQSVSKPVTYAMCLEADGYDFVDEWIGVEPAGRPFNTQDLDSNNCPFNSSVNSGAIMACGIFASQFPTLTWKEIVDKVRMKWNDLSGRDIPTGFSQETFDSEKNTAYNNFAIAYNLKGRRGLPRDVNLLKMLDVYLGCCSIEISCEALAIAAATLANGGICPITATEVFPAHVTRTVLSEMMTCGMYDQAGRFVVEVGLPSKSGVSGALLVIVPNVFGFATFSPRLNNNGNSVRGIEFCKKLVSLYRVHSFEPLRAGNTGAKIDPRRNGLKQEKIHNSHLTWGVQVGDKYALLLAEIFQFALCQTALASPQGLSQNTLDMIRVRHEVVFGQVDERQFHDIVEAVRETPGELRHIKTLTEGVWINDSDRSIILIAMFDIIAFDCDVGEQEKSVAIRIAEILGIDREIALLELNRYECDLEGHRDRGEGYHGMLERIGHKDAVFLGRSALVPVSGSRGRDEDNHKAIKQAMQLTAEGDMSTQNQILRDELYRLRRKVYLLEERLHGNENPPKI